MPVGQFVTKQTWLLDDVEVRGIVRVDGLNTGDDVGTGDGFALEPDAEYRHLVDLIPGSGGRLGCETYPLPAEHTNHDVGWPLQQKAGDRAFEVTDPTTDQKRNLKVGDHIQVVGRWTIDHHPETCVTRARGLLRVGCVWAELHPFRYDRLLLVTPRMQSSTILSLAAPIHTESYLGGGKWLANEIAGVASKIFISDDGTNYHNSMFVTLTLPAPALPTGWTAEPSLIRVAETVMKNAGGNGPGVRTVTTTSTGARIVARVSPFTTIPADALFVADVDGPARGDGIFQAQYTVGWAPRLVADPVAVKLGPGETGRDLPVVVRNVGPDPVTITDARLGDVWGPGGDPTVFVFGPISPVTVQGGGTATLSGRFVPNAGGVLSATLAVTSNDPEHPVVHVPMTGATADSSGRLRVRTEPAVIPLDVDVEVTVVAEDTGNGARVAGLATMRNFDAGGRPEEYRIPTNVPFGRTWRRQRVLGIPILWPSGTVTAAHYDQDQNAPIPFQFG